MTMLSPPPPVLTQEAVVAAALNVSHDQAAKLRELVREWREATPVPTGDAAKAEPAARRRCPVVTITSGKGGVGKTNITVNLAIALSQLGARVTVLDADLGLANADLLCGITPTTRLESAIEGRPGERRGLRQLAVAGPAGVRLIPGAVGLPRIAELTAGQRESLVAQLIDLESDSDIVLIDTGAGIGASVLSFVAAADLALVVATPEPTSIADAYAMVKATRPLQRRGAKTALVVNQVTSVREGIATHERIAGVAERFLGMRPDHVGSVRRDEAVSRAVRERSPFVLSYPGSGASKDMRALACGLRDRLQVGLIPKSGRPSGFWARILGRG